MKEERSVWMFVCISCDHEHETPLYGWFPDFSRESHDCPVCGSIGRFVERRVVEILRLHQEAWRIFRYAFKDGDDVVAETSGGAFYYGRLEATEEGIWVRRPKVNEFIDWDDIEFLAHDGFPVKKLRELTPEQADVLARRKPASVIRDILDGKVPGQEPEPTSFGGGCPFVAGPCVPIVRHVDDYEDTTVFVASDGAQLHSYDPRHLFDVGAI